MPIHAISAFVVTILWDLTMTFHFYPLHNRTQKTRREFLCNLIAIPRVQHHVRQISIWQHTYSDNHETPKNFCILCDTFVLRLSLAKSAFLELQSDNEIFEIFPEPENKQAGVSLRYRIDLYNFHFSPSSYDKKESRVRTWKFLKVHE